jgi:hypothetical protein
MTDNIMLVTGFCALLVAGLMFRLARPATSLDGGMMEGYFYIESANYAGTGSGVVAGRGVSEGAGTAVGTRPGTGTSTSRLGSPTSAISRDHDDETNRAIGAPTLWTNEAIGFAILSKLNHTA